MSLWDISTGPDPANRFAACATGITAASVFVVVLKLVGAVVAVAAVQPWHAHANVVATALWGAFGLLALYSAGNVLIWVGTATGLMEPSAAWRAAGGVSVGAVLYVLFFFAGAAMFGVLAMSYHRRHRMRWTSAVIGIVGAPIILALVLDVVPGILGQLGLLPA